MSVVPPRDGVAVTVGLACYNVEPWIEECVESLFGQTFGDFEIVAIDDGSTDRTGEMLDRLAAGDDRLRVVHQGGELCVGGPDGPPGGLGPARNEILRRARGRFLTFIDGDDRLAAGCLEKAHRRAVEEALDVVTFGWARVEDGTGKTIERRSDHEGLDLNDLDGLRQTCFSGRLNLMSPTRLVRASPYRDHGLSFPTALHEDLYVTPFLYFYGKRFGTIDEDLYFRRVRKESIAQTISVAHIDGIIGAFPSWKARLTAEGSFERFRDSIAAGMFAYAAGYLDKIERLGGSDPVLFRYLRGRMRSIPELERYRRRLSPEGRRRHAELFALLETATEEEDGTARHFPLLVAANDRLKWQRAREKTGCAWDVVFAPHKDYHAVTSVPIARLLRRRGLKVAFLDFTDVRGDEGSLGALARLGEEQSYSSGDFIGGGHDFKMLAVFNDWDRLSTRPLVLDAREAGAATVGLIEGICDFDDVDTGFRRDPYRSVEWVLGAGRHDRRHFGELGRRFGVAGFARIAGTLAKPYRPPARRRAVINVNFTYNVLEEKRKDWLASAIEGCRLAGVDWVISQHPQDGGDLGARPVDERPFEEVMDENAVLISRFSFCIVEALAMGRGVVYHNPGIEKVEKFRDPLGAYSVSCDAPGLAAALKAEMERLGEAAGRRRRFLKEHCDVSRNFRPHEKAARALWRIHMRRHRKRAFAGLIRNLSRSSQRAIRIAAVDAPRFIAGIPARAPRLAATVLALIAGLALIGAGIFGEPWGAWPSVPGLALLGLVIVKEMVLWRRR